MYQMCPVRIFKVNYNRPMWLIQELIELGRERDIALSLVRTKEKNWGFFHTCAKNLRNEYNRGHLMMAL